MADEQLANILWGPAARAAYSPSRRLAYLLRAACRNRPDHRYQYLGKAPPFSAQFTNCPSVWNSRGRIVRVLARKAAQITCG